MNGYKVKHDKGKFREVSNLSLVAYLRNDHRFHSLRRFAQPQSSNSSAERFRPANRRRSLAKGSAIQ